MAKERAELAETQVLHTQRSQRPLLLVQLPLPLLLLPWRFLLPLVSVVVDLVHHNEGLVLQGSDRSAVSIRRLGFVIEIGD